MRRIADQRPCQYTEALFGSVVRDVDRRCDGPWDVHPDRSKIEETLKRRYRESEMLKILERHERGSADQDATAGHSHIRTDGVPKRPPRGKSEQRAKGK